MLRRVLMMLAGVLVLGALGAGSAVAARVHPFSSFNGEPGALLSNPWGIDVDGAGGVVLVGDSSSHQVAQFDLSGAPREFSSLGSNELTGAGAPLAFEAPTVGVADVPGGGDVYVTDFPHNVVDVFNPAGEYVSQLTAEGLAAVGGTPQGSFSGPSQVRVDPIAGDVWVLDSGHDVVDEFEPEEGGKKHRYLRQIDASVLEEPLSGLQDVAVGSEGDVFVAGSNGSRFQVDEFSALGEFQFVLDANNATSVAVDTATTPNTVYALDEGRKVGLYEATSFSGVPLEQFSAPGEHELQDLGVDSGSHTVYATDYGDSQVDVFAPLVVLPTPVTGEASGVLPTSATLNGTVSPEGVEPSECVFEYGESESYGSTVGCEESPAAIGAGNSPVAVHANVSSLHIGTGYHFRLKAANATGSEYGSDATFATTPPPTIAGVATQNVTASSADLTAQIDPNGAATTYHVEYGTTTGYGTTAPVPDAVVGSGTVAKPVTQTIAGLSANTTYHWRIVATSAAGTVASSDQTFVDDTSGAVLPDGRAYELVTPAQKNGALIDVAFGSGSSWSPQIARSGMDLIAPSIQCFAGAQSCSGDRYREGEAYEFARTRQGWVTHALASSAGATLGANSLWAADAETHATLFSAPIPPEGGDDFFTRRANGSISDVGPVGEGPEGAVVGSGGNFGKFGVILATSDFSHVVYQGRELWSLDGEPETRQSVYEYAGTGNARPLLVGVTGRQGSTSLVSGCNTFIGGGSILDGDGVLRYGSLSDDGRTVYFTAQCGREASNELYARVDGERSDAHTVTISSSVPSSCVSVECQTAPGRSGTFEGASSDGSRVFFTSTQQLTDNASQGTGEAGKQCHSAGEGGCNLYESVCAEPCGTPAEEPAAKERRLVDVSEGAKLTGGPRVQGVMAISPDGSHVYFVARGVLTGGQENQNHEQAQDGKDNLYVYADGQPLRFIATLPPSDEGEFAGPLEWAHGIGLANVTPDGRFVVFLSHGALTPDDTRSEEGAPAQVYRYDALTGTLVRISIGEHGFNDNGNAGITDANIAGSFVNGFALGVGPARANPTMSGDGSYVFFESPVGLAPGALDDVQTGANAFRPEYAENIYEYHDGDVSLISDGKDTTANSALVRSVQLFGSNESGADVFFATNDQLTLQDTDTQRDYYDARICTSEDPCSHPPSAPPVCSEEACHGAAPASVAEHTPGSESFTGMGNLAPPGGQASGSVKPRSLTGAQKLAKALRACRAKRGSRRAVCERRARKRFAAVKRAKRATNRRRAK